MDIGKRCRTTLNFCVCYYFSYGVIFVCVLTILCVGGNFICGSVDYPKI